MNSIDFIASGDLHATTKTPRNRKDNYLLAWLDKFEQILEITKEQSSTETLTLAGDIFNTPTEPYKLTGAVLELIKYYDVQVLAVPGQHDLRYHVSGLDDTPLGMLIASAEVQLLSNKQRTCISKGKKEITFIGAGWNEEPQEEADVLVVHRMVTKTGPLWPGQTDFISAQGILNKYPWAKCIISGDNHKPHLIKRNKKIQLNVGCIMRNRKDQIEYAPHVWKVNVFDTKVWKKKINVEDAENVFDFGKIKQEEIREEAKKKAEEDISKFIVSLKLKEKEKPKYETVLKQVIKTVNPEKQVITFINQIMEEAKDGLN